MRSLLAGPNVAEIRTQEASQRRVVVDRVMHRPTGHLKQLLDK
jgi:hypothetical protein